MVVEIFRVEHKETLKGPYTHRENQRASTHVIAGDAGIYDDVMTMFYSHPGPDDDPGIQMSMSQRDLSFRYDMSGWRFGFNSINQLRKWFYIKEVWAILEKHGFVLAVYHVPEEALIVGERQMVFLKKCAIRIKELPILEALS